MNYWWKKGDNNFTCMQRVNGGKYKIEINQEAYFYLLRIFIFTNLYVPLSIGTVLPHTC